MINWARIEGFDWDEGNSRKSADKHGIAQAETEQIFFEEPLLIAPDARHSEREARLHALGLTDVGRYLHVTFTLRRGETLIRVISARPMNRKERVRYDQESQGAPKLPR